MGGAKNHGVILPDADLDQVVADVLAGAFGSAGERCMSMPVIVPVGQKTAEAVRERLLQEIPKLRIGVATDPDAQMGPVVTAEHKKKIEGYIQLAADEGAELVIDGRGRSLPGHEEGFFLWPTLIDHATPSMKSYQDEIFGPVLQIVRARDVRGGAELPERPSPRQRGFGLHAQWRCGPAFRCRGRGRYGRRQFSDASAGRLLQPWRLEGLGFRRP